ncbi:MAG: gliding motility-associated ABC transporter permease subunit GldF [Vicingaceae bacterium]
MRSLLIKEINSFLGSLIGYLVIIVFLSSLGLFIWVFPGESNILDSGYSNLNAFFFIAPWVFLFLIPAITMRSFADERKQGTLELLITKPLSEIQIILSKFLAGLVLVLFSLLPATIYVYSVYQLGNPIGNLDLGATWGSYIGLLLLGAAYVAIGIFASSVTDNQIISFILGVFLCFFFFVGFDSIAGLEFLKGIDGFVLKLGINEHYLSLSRGVIDSRDLIYFIALIGFFILLTQTKLSSRKW